MDLGRQQTVFVTAFIAQDETSSEHSTSARVEEFKKLARTGIRLHVFVSRSVLPAIPSFPNVFVELLELEELTLFQNMASAHGTSPYTLPCPASGTALHDSAAYLLLKNAKPEIVVRAIDSGKWPGCKQFAWIDFSIGHVVRDWDVFTAVLVRNAQSSFQPDKVYIAGCSWALGTNANQLWDAVNWRYCGGFFLGDVPSLRDMAARTRTYASSHAKLTWEVNVWHALELRGDWSQCTHFNADNNETIVNIPAACIQRLDRKRMVPSAVVSKAAVTSVTPTHASIPAAASVTERVSHDVALTNPVQGLVISERTKQAWADYATAVAMLSTATPPNGGSTAVASGVTNPAEPPGTVSTSATVPASTCVVTTPQTQPEFTKACATKLITPHALRGVSTRPSDRARWKTVFVTTIAGAKEKLGAHYELFMKLATTGIPLHVLTDESTRQAMSSLSLPNVHFEALDFRKLLVVVAALRAAQTSSKPQFAIPCPAKADMVAHVINDSRWSHIQQFAWIDSNVAGLVHNWKQFACVLVQNASTEFMKNRVYIPGNATSTSAHGADCTASTTTCTTTTDAASRFFTAFFLGDAKSLSDMAERIRRRILSTLTITYEKDLWRDIEHDGDWPQCTHYAARMDDSIAYIPAKFVDRSAFARAWDPNVVRVAGSSTSCSDEHLSGHSSSVADPKDVSKDVAQSDSQATAPMDTTEPGQPVHVSRLATEPVALETSAKVLPLQTPAQTPTENPLSSIESDLMLPHASTKPHARDHRWVRPAGTTPESRLVPFIANHHEDSRPLRLPEYIDACTRLVTLLRESTSDPKGQRLEKEDEETGRLNACARLVNLGIPITIVCDEHMWSMLAERCVAFDVLTPPSHVSFRKLTSLDVSPDILCTPACGAALMAAVASYPVCDDEADNDGADGHQRVIAHAWIDIDAVAKVEHWDTFKSVMSRNAYSAFKSGTVYVSGYEVNGGAAFLLADNATLCEFASRVTSLAMPQTAPANRKGKWSDILEASQGGGLKQEHNIRVLPFTVTEPSAVASIPPTCLRIVASLTTIPARFESCRLTVDSLLAQPDIDMVYLCIPNRYKRFPDSPTGAVPSWVSCEPYSKRVRVTMMDTDWGGASKYIGALDHIRHDWVLVVDDDQVYGRRLLRRMLLSNDASMSLSAIQNRHKYISKDTSGGLVHAFVGHLVPGALLTGLLAQPMVDATRFLDGQWVSACYFRLGISTLPSGVDEYHDIYDVLSNGHECQGPHSLSSLGVRHKCVQAVAKAYGVVFHGDGTVTSAADTARA
jgi:hypothetical protein